jgi:hypothetical protein
MNSFGNVCYVYKDFLHYRLRGSVPLDTIHFVKYENGLEKENIGDWIPENISKTVHLKIKFIHNIPLFLKVNLFH